MPVDFPKPKLPVELNLHYTDVVNESQGYVKQPSKQIGEYSNFKLNEHYRVQTAHDVSVVYHVSLALKSSRFGEAPKIAKQNFDAKARVFSTLFSRLRNTQLEAAISESAYIPNLQYNWDDEGALRISVELYTKAIEFLKAYSGYLQKQSRLLPVPEINPCKDGSLDFSWRTASARLLINIKNNAQEAGFLAHFYGDLYNDKTPIKGNVSLSPVAPHLAAWMTYL